VTRKKKRDNPVFVVSIMVATVIASVFVTLEFMGSQSTSDEKSQRQGLETNRVSNTAYAFAQAEELCLQQAKQSHPHPGALYVDGRSTQNRGSGQYRIFIRVDTAAAMGSEAILICNAELAHNQLRIRRIKQIEAIEGSDDNEGIRSLLKALRNRD